MNWRAEAETLFFIAHEQINEIAKELSMSRKTVSAYLSSCSNYGAEKEYRKELNKAKRKEYKKKWEEDNRQGLGIRLYGHSSITEESLRREHDLAAVILSGEKY